jgi:hypothetical protein
VNDRGHEADGNGAAVGLLPWPAAALAGVLSLAAFLLWGLTGADIVIGMIGVYCI